jgi:hypothetical protein
VLAACLRAAAAWAAWVVWISKSNRSELVQIRKARQRCRAFLLWSQQLEHFSAKWNPVSRKKMLLTNNFARILFANRVSTFAEYALNAEGLLN